MGTDKPVSVSGIAVSGADAGDYNLQNTTAATTAAIIKAGLTVNFTAQDKTYDGDTDAAITGASLDGAVSGEDVSVDSSGATAHFAVKDAGTRAVSAGGFALGGQDAGNYKIATVNDTSAMINPRPLTVTFTAVDKVYDGSTAADVHLSSNDTLTGDTVAFSFDHAAFADKDAGQTKPVTASGIALGGADAADYALQNTSADTAAAITPKGVTVQFTAADKAWDGTTTATITNPTVSGAVTGDDLVVDATNATADFAGSGIGTWSVSGVGFALAGADRANYEIDRTDSTTASITVAGLSIGIDASQRRRELGCRQRADVALASEHGRQQR